VPKNIDFSLKSLLFATKSTKMIQTHTSAFFKSIAALQETIQSRTNITEADMTLVFQLAHFKPFEKGEFLTEDGKVENYLYFIVEGVTRSFFFKEDQNISLDFHFTGQFVSVYESFLDRTPAQHALEALTQVSTMRIQHADLNKLYAQSPKFEQVARIFTEELFKKTSERVKGLLSQSATERYVHLLNAYPEYVQNIPLKYLASYLNIKPESLSRIRKKL
jgi:CRP-like cAMP-binding protein